MQHRCEIQRDKYSSNKYNAASAAIVFANMITADLTILFGISNRLAQYTSEIPAVNGIA